MVACTCTMYAGEPGWRAPWRTMPRCIGVGRQMSSISSAGSASASSCGCDKPLAGTSDGVSRVAGCVTQCDTTSRKAWAMRASSASMVAPRNWPPRYVQRNCRQPCWTRPSKASGAGNGIPADTPLPVSSAATCQPPASARRLPSNWPR
ncbi:hypothetical protein D9M72_542390 [compost metagenome]